MAESAEIELEARVNVSTGVAFCVMVWGDQRGDFSPDEMRAHGSNCFEVAELAMQNATFFRFLRSNGATNDVIANMMEALNSFRDDVTS